MSFLKLFNYFLVNKFSHKNVFSEIREEIKLDLRKV